MKIPNKNALAKPNNESINENVAVFSKKLDLKMSLKLIIFFYYLKYR